MEPNERIVYYGRTSTGRQEKDETIETQVFKLDQAYKGRNVIDKISYMDDGYLGSTMNRPGLDKLKRDAKNGKFDVVAIYALDRFSRGGQGKLWFILDYFKENGVRVEVQGRPLEIGTPEGVLSTSILADIAQYEKEKIKQRMVDGKYRKVSAGIPVGYYPPWGYKLAKRDRANGKEALFEIDYTQAWKIKKMFEVYLQLENLNQASKKLFDMEIYARGKKGEEGKFKVPILPGTLKQYLQNESYIGKFWFGKKYYCEATRFVREYSKTRARGGLTGWKWRPKSDWKLVKVKPIIDEATFNRVQNILKLRHDNYYRIPKYNYLLQKLVICIHCGRPYRGKPNGMPFKKKDGTISRGFRYICYNRHEYKPCLGKGMNARILEGAVWNVVKTFISNPDNIKQAISEDEKQKNIDKKENERNLGLILSKKEDIKRKTSRLLALYSEGQYEKEDLDAQIIPLKAEVVLLDKQVEEIKTRMRIIEESDLLDEELKKSCEIYYQKVDDNNFQLKKKIVRDWVKEINIMDDGGIRIKIRVPKIAGELLKNWDTLNNSLNLNTANKKSHSVVRLN
jgi:site-specific DNA recombinase